MTVEAARALDLLAKAHQRLAVAESLTGGLVAAAVTEVPGASRAFLGSVTAYATGMKRELLGVDEGLLASGGAVQEAVARQMAAGVRQKFGAEWGIATTGVAGPDPQDGAAVGTVFIAVAGPAGDQVVARQLALTGDRSAIRDASVSAVLKLLWEQLVEQRRVRIAEPEANNTENGGGSDVYSPE